MACDHVFEPKVEYGCILEIVNEVRSNKISLDTAQKALCVAGGLIAILKGSPDNLMSAKNSEELPATADGIAARLFELCPTVDPSEDLLLTADRWRPNPDNVRMILELLMKFLPLILV